MNKTLEGRYFKQPCGKIIKVESVKSDKMNIKMIKPKYSAAKCDFCYVRDIGTEVKESEIMALEV